MATPRRVASEAEPFGLDVCNRCEHVFRRPTPDMIAALAVPPELRVVYRSLDGKVSVHRKTAVRRTARFLMRKKFPCACEADELDPHGSGRVVFSGGPCWLHNHDPEVPFFDVEGDDPLEVNGQRHPRMNSYKFENRMVRWLLWHDDRVRELGRSPFLEAG